MTRSVATAGHDRPRRLAAPAAAWVGGRRRGTGRIGDGRPSRSGSARRERCSWSSVDWWPLRSSSGGPSSGGRRGAATSSYLDGASILPPPAPPNWMTAVTATIVDGGPAPTASGSRFTACAPMIRTSGSTATGRAPPQRGPRRGVPPAARVRDPRRERRPAQGCITGLSFISRWKRHRLAPADQGAPSLTRCPNGYETLPQGTPASMLTAAAPTR